MGRPRAPIDAEQVYKLARIGCTQEEIGDIFGVDHSVISRRFAQEYTSARAEWKTSLRRAQTIRAVKDRSDSMLIHLGKTYLGQKDELKLSGDVRTSFEQVDDGRDPDLPTPGETA